MLVSTGVAAAVGVIGAGVTGVGAAGAAAVVGLDAASGLGVESGLAAAVFGASGVPASTLGRIIIGICVGIP